MRISYLLVAIALFNAREVYLQAGSLDPDFGKGGWVHTDFGGKDQANAVAIQSDGRILVGGQTNGINGGYDFALIRYLPNGDPDPDFGTLGKMTWDFGSAQENIEFINVLSDEKIIIGGWTESSPNSLGILIRLNPDGSPDMGFGQQGILRYRYGRSTGPLSLAVQEDGKYLVSGITVVDSFDLDWIISRFYPDGTIDSSFNHTGHRYFKFLTRENIPFSMMIQDDHKIFMTGCAGVTSKTNFAFLRLNEDGSLDQSFGNGGSLQTDFQNNQDVAYTSIRLNDGRYIVSGTSKDSITNLDFALAMYKADGTLDPGFGLGGKMTYDLKGPVDDGLYMIQQPDGKLLVCGLSLLLGHNSFVIVRFNPDGSIDQSFGKKGVAAFDAGSIIAYNTPSFLMQKDGKLVMVANYKDGTNINFLTMRFLNDIVIKNDDHAVQHQLLNVSPNPVNDNLNININEMLSGSDLNIQIINLQSQIVDRSIIHSSDLNDKVLNYSVKNVKPGFYLMKWMNDKFGGTIPLIKI
jgi:uncharacterized delta-60 repeat protein